MDDVITAGTAIGETLPILAGQGAAPAGVVIALDRQERGRGELSAVQEVERTHGIRVLPLVTLHDLITHLAGRAEYEQPLRKLAEYQARYGIAAQ